MTKIYKYPLRIVDRQTVMMPDGARILSVGHQGDAGDLAMWARVDPSAKLQPRYFVIHGTGHPCEATDASRFIGTVLMQMHGAPLVWHVFEVDV